MIFNGCYNGNILKYILTVATDSPTLLRYVGIYTIFIQSNGSFINSKLNLSVEQYFTFRIAGLIIFLT